MIRCAIYARKSSLKHKDDSDLKSTKRQIANALKFAASKGWTVDPAAIFEDDAISGELFQQLKNRGRLLQEIDAGRFDVLIVRDKSRFTRREGMKGVSELSFVADAGVAIWFYATGDQFKHGDIGSDVQNVVEAHANHAAIKQSKVTVHEALTQLAEKGDVASGKSYAIDIQKIDGHKRHVVNPAQAAVVVRIFKLTAKGDGYNKVARILTDDKVPTIRPKASKSDGWSGASVRHILNNDIYRGVIIWNRTTKVKTSGKVKIVVRPKSEWIRRQDPTLRIIDDVLWQAAHRQMERRSASCSYGTPRRANLDSQYLLTGFLQCECGGGMHVRKRTMQEGRIVAGYACTRHYTKGKANGCRNSARWHMADFDAAVVGSILKQLTPDKFEQLLAKTKAAYTAKSTGQRIDRLQADLTKATREADNCTAAVRRAKNPKAAERLADLLDAAEERKAAIEADLQQARGTAGPHRPWPEVEAQMRKTVDSWRTQLASRTPIARDWLRRFLSQPVVCHPVHSGAVGDRVIRFEGRIEALGLLGGTVVSVGQSSSNSNDAYHPVFAGEFRPPKRKDYPTKRIRVA
jgi:DNA invertase Pin-like site-specific DNA recombinase